MSPEHERNELNCMLSIFFTMFFYGKTIHVEITTLHPYSGHNSVQCKPDKKKLLAVSREKPCFALQVGVRFTEPQTL